MKRFCFALLMLAMFAGCSSEPEKPKTAEQKPAATAEKAEPVTGREAFQRIFVSARLWNVDAKPVRLESLVSEEDNGQAGKSKQWKAMFASPARRSIKPFTWSAGGKGFPERGVSPAGVDDTYNPSNANTQAWDSAFLKVDSDKAFEVAQKHGGEALLKKNPQQAVSYVLDWNPRENELTWHVNYGASAADAKLRIAVNATSGEFLRTEK